MGLSDTDTWNRHSAFLDSKLQWSTEVSKCKIAGRQADKLSKK